MSGYSPSAPHKEPRIFPFEYRIDDLDNGLRVITVPLPYPDLVALYAVVRTGSRNEVEPGKSGFAHFFEHMMFRGTEAYPPEKYSDVLKRMGASQNAFTTDDFTAYHMVIGKQDLETAMAVEADRFQNLSYAHEAFRTEAKAVLGEYNKNSANPIVKVFEEMREASFREHTYRHTTMGFLEDIQRMPEQFEYSRTFFDRFYRPENTVLILAGDVTRDRAVDLTRRYWGGWKRGGFTQQIPAEPEPNGPHEVSIPWSTPTLPWIVVGYRGPAYSDEAPDMAALDLAAEVAFSQSSALYRKLVIEEQKADTLFSFFRDSRDPGLLCVGARLKDPKHLDEVRREILSAVEGLRERLVPAERLAAVKSNLKYGFALAMDNTESVARSLAQYVQLVPTPETIDRLHRLYDEITPESIRRSARTYLAERGRTIATLTGPGAETGRPDAEPGRRVRILLRPSPVPLVSIRVLFAVGAANDPPGKEGVAALTAAMLSRGGSRSRTYEQIIEALYPMAAGVGAQVDKEMTVFGGTTHADNLEAYESLLSEMILEPGWREDDFRRVRDDAISHLKVDLRGNNDEELGKEALYLFIYGPGHPYGHETTGTIASLEKITLQDVKQFHRAHYTRANLTVALAGGYPDACVARLSARFGALPEGTPSRVEVPRAAPCEGLGIRIIRKDTRATAISLGFPIEVTRAHADWPALWVASSWLGQHRSSNSHLYQRMREIRGLNYGDYAYIEHFPRGMFQFQPDANLARQRQIFQIWIRPVEPANAHFALRLAVHELRSLLEKGITGEQFETTREFLSKFVPLMTPTQGLQLGYALDGEYYGTGDFVPWIRGRLANLTLEDVNRAIRAHLTWKHARIVIVAKDAEALKEAIVSGVASPISYNAPKPAEILEEDRIIGTSRLPVLDDRVEVVDEEEVFSL